VIHVRVSEQEASMILSECDLQRAFGDLGGVAYNLLGERRGQHFFEAWHEADAVGSSRYDHDVIASLLEVVP